MTAPSVAAIVVAGGTGERLGVDGGKQLALVAGLPVLSWTVRALAEAPEVDLIIVVTHPERVAEYRAVAVAPLGVSTPVAFAAGGDTRQASVAAGLAEVPESVSVVIVQDGARPLITAELVSKALKALAEDVGADGAVVGHPAVDTLKLVKDGAVVSTPQRSRFWAVQTPQVFRSKALREAYAQAAAEEFVGTDDSSLVERAGGRVVLVEGPRDNIKITLAEDLVLVEAALLSKESGGVG